MCEKSVFAVLQNEPTADAKEKTTSSAEKETDADKTTIRPGPPAVQGGCVPVVSLKLDGRVKCRALVDSGCGPALIAGKDVLMKLAKGRSASELARLMEVYRKATSIR